MCEKLYPVNTKLDTFLNPLDLNTRSARLLVIVSSDSHESYTLNWASVLLLKDTHLIPASQR